MSLLDQLRKRQSEAVTSTAVQSIHVKASLLFDKKDAAKIELDAVYQLALGGLEVLKKHDPRVKPFEATLFSPSGKEVSRELQTKEANARLDESINTFIALIAPFFMEKHTHKVLEYLIRRYSIHQFNKTAIFKAILPYHQTMMFLKMISITKLKGTNLWEFLEPTLGSGVPPKRNIIVSRMLMDRNLLLFVLEMVKEAVASRTAYRTLFGFYMTALLEAIETQGLSENFLRDLWPFIITGLSSSDENYQTATIMILSTACWKAAVAHPLIKGAIDSMIAHTTPHLHSNAIRALIMIVQNTVASASASSPSSTSSDSFSIVSGLVSEDTISVLASWTDSPQILSGFVKTQQYDASVLLSFLLKKLGQDLPKDASRAAFLVKLFNTLDIPDLVSDLTVTLLRTYSNTSASMSNGSASSSTTISKKANTKKHKRRGDDSSDSESESDEEDSSADYAKYAKKLSELMAAIDLKYPTQLDQGIAKMLKEHPTESKWSELFKNGRHHAVEAPGASSPSTLTLCLRESVPSIQIFALNKLLELNADPSAAKDSRRKELLQATILEHLKSGQQQLILNALDVPNLGELVQAEPLFTTLESLISATGEVSCKAFSHLMTLYLKPISKNASATSSSSTPGKKSKKAKASAEEDVSSSKLTLEISNASAKLMPVILSALFSSDSGMRSLAGTAALQFHQHFVGHVPALPCQNVFSHYSSSLLNDNLALPHSILALATSAVANNDYCGPNSSWRAIASNPRTRIFSLVVLNCALAQVASKAIQPHASRSAEQECLTIANVLLPHLMDDAQTMLLAVDTNVEGHLFSLESGKSKSDHGVLGIPSWGTSQLQSVLGSTAFYKREYFFEYLVWAIHNLVQALALIATPGASSDHLLSVAQATFKLLCSSQSPSLFAPHLKKLLGFLGSDIHVAQFLENMWTTPQASSSASSTTLILDPSALGKDLSFPLGHHGSSTSALVALRALSFLASLLASRLKSDQLSSKPLLYTDFAIDIVPGLFVALAHQESAVRVAAHQCLHTVGKILEASASAVTPNGSSKSSKSNKASGNSVAEVLGSLIRDLSTKRSEFALSSEFLRHSLSIFFQSSDETKVVLHQFLITKAIAMSTTFARYTLLHILLPTPNGVKLSITSNLTDRIIKAANVQLQAEENLADVDIADIAGSSSGSNALTVTDIFTFRLLNTTVQQWQPDAAETLNRTESLFNLLISALQSAVDISLPLDPAIATFFTGASEKLAAAPSSNSSASSATATKAPTTYNFNLQVATLKQITPEFFSLLSSNNQRILFEQLCELVLSPKHAVKDAVQEVLRTIPIDPQIIVFELQTCVEKTNPAPSLDTAPPAKRAKHSATATAPTSLQVPAAPMDKSWIARLTVVLELLQYKHEALSMGDQYVSSLFALLRNTVESDNALAQDPSAEYIEQLIFSTLISITEALSLGKTPTPASDHKDKMQVDGQDQADAETVAAAAAAAEQEALEKQNALKIVLDKSQLALLESKYDVDCIIQIIRLRSNPTLQNNALLLLSHIAKVYPGKVMANVMSIFSFMGASSERSDDNYTFNVIEKTVERVIPALLSHAPGVEGRVSASALLAIFVDRIDSIPQHRRLMLFTHILTKVLRRGYLPLVLALLLHRQSQHQLQDKMFEKQEKILTEISSSEALSMSSFALTLFHKLSPYECVSAIVYTLYWLNGFDAKLDRSPLVTGRTKDISSADKANMHEILVQFALSYVTSRTFLNQLMELVPADQQRMQNVYLALFQTLLMFAKFVSSGESVSSLASKDAILDGIYKLTDKVNELMSIYTFFDAMGALFKQNDATIKHRALVLFNERIKAVARAEKAGFDFGAQTTVNFIHFTVNMFKTVFAEAQSSASGDALTLALNKQTAALSVEIVARLFGEVDQHQPIFVHLTELVVGALQPYTENLAASNLDEVPAHSESQIKIQASLVIALATLVTNSKEKLLSLINKIYPVLLATLRIAITTDAQKDHKHLLRHSCLAAIHVVTTVMHRFLSQYWPELLRTLLQPTDIFHGTVALWDQVTSIVTMIGEIVPARLLMEPLVSTFEYILQPNDAYSAETLNANRTPCMKLLTQITGIVAKQLDRSTLVSHHKQLFKVFLTYFDYAELTTSNAATAPTYATLVSIEDSIIEAFMQLTLKLNENMFKPLFLVILDWAKVSSTAAANLVQKTNEPIYTPRSHFFYRLILTLAEELKGIFVPYFAYILEHATRVVLQQAHAIKKNDPILKATNAFALNPSGALGGLLIHHQVSLVLNGLQKMFLYDKDGFLDKSKYDRMMPILVDQLDSSHIEQYKTRVTQSIVPCLSQMAVCIGNDALWKPLNHNVLAKSRHSDAQVRFSVLLVQADFYNRLGEAYLPLLHESAQTFAELLEDSSPEVERQCLALIKQIEGILGEEGAVLSLLSK